MTISFICILLNSFETDELNASSEETRKENLQLHEENKRLLEKIKTLGKSKVDLRTLLVLTAGALFRGK